MFDTELGLSFIFVLTINLSEIVNNIEIFK